MPKRAYTKKEQEEYDAWLKRQEELGLNADSEELEQWAKDHPELLPDDEEDEEEETEETEAEKPTEEQRAQWLREEEETDIRERKKALLEKLEKQIDESGKTDIEIAELKRQLIEQVKLNTFWLAVLENKNWEGILRKFFRVIYGMTNKMCAKTVVAVTEKDGQMVFTYDFFDENGKPVLTEFNDIYGEDEGEEDEKT